MNPATRRRLPSLWIPFALALFGGAIAASSSSAAGRCTGIALAIGGALYLLRWQWVVSRPNLALEMLEIENQSLRARTEMETQRRLDILANLRDGVILLGAGQQVQLFNPAAQLMLGTSSHLSLDGALLAVFREPECLENIERARRGEPVEWTMKRGPRILQVRAVAFAAADAEEGASVLLTLGDITHQEALETTRQKFISNASHELKTPVTSIRLAAENLQEDGLVLEDGEPSLRSILRNTDRMAMLLNDISELSRIETGAMRLEVEELNLGAFIQGLQEDFEAQGRPRSIGLRVECPPELAAQTLHADPFRLRQLLDNLLSNALKFSPEGAPVQLRLACEGPWITWSVADRGPGIAPSEQERIFERFYRSPSARGVPGTGLGLSIVKHLALLMGGEVGLQSTPGQGSTFTLRLPFPGKPPALPGAVPETR